jgi:hypothetical protein
MSPPPVYPIKREHTVGTAIHAAESHDPDYPTIMRSVQASARMGT